MHYWLLVAFQLHVSPKSDKACTIFYLWSFKHCTGLAGDPAIAITEEDIESKANDICLSKLSNLSDGAVSNQLTDVGGGGQCVEGDGDIRGVGTYSNLHYILCTCHIVITFHINLPSPKIQIQIRHSLYFYVTLSGHYSLANGYAPLPFPVLPNGADPPPPPPPSAAKAGRKHLNK